jgi:hypothetical protein
MSAVLRCSLASLALVAAGGCSGRASVSLVCASDAECSAGEVCFPDGCGDPGRDIAVEVVPGASTGQLAQDFLIDRLQPIQDIQAFEPPIIHGSIQQKVALGIDAVPYVGEVTFRAYGQSVVIPGRTRWAQYAIVPDPSGAYEVPIPTGSFALTYTAKNDARLPPQRWEKQLIQPGQTLTLSPTFPDPTSLLSIQGRLLRNATAGTLVTGTAMQVQALDAQTATPLSQPATVVAETGGFTLFVEPGIGLSTVTIRATPQDATALVPSKSFDISLATFVAGSALELGDYGSPLQVTGRIVDSSGAAMGGVDIFIDGRAVGGGTFRTAAVTTDALGTFSLATLLPMSGTQLTLWAFPDVKSSAGMLKRPVSLPASGGNLGDLRAPDKVQVSGSLTRPDGSVGSGAFVEGEAVAALGDRPLPQGITRSGSDAEGRFTLRLDPAIYRLDFTPTDLLPRVSRFVTIPANVDASGNLQPVELPEFTLSRGRRVTGTISSIPRWLGTPEPTPAPYASLKFFRVVMFEGKPSSLLLAETVADAAGNYSVTLPTAQSAP